MKLADLLQVIFKNGPIDNNKNDIVDYIISGDVLKRYKDELMKCDEFKEVLDIQFLSFPLIEKNNRKSQVKSYIVKEGMKLQGNVILYSITLTPEIFKPNFEIVKDGASISPTIYNTVTFTPYKIISLTWTPELAQDISVTTFGETELKKQLHDTLDKILDNPDEYIIKGQRSIIIRGLFDSSGDPNSPNEHVKL
jgi:hypothetical protein